MNVVAAALGALLLITTALDVFETTLSVRGGGPLSTGLGELLWRGALRLHRRWPSHRLLAYGGTAILVATIGLWAFLLWLGWSLVFLGDPGAIVNTRTGSPAGAYEVFSYTGFALVTLGTGSYRPGGTLWQILSMFVAGSGFAGLTLSMTFLLSVMPATVNKRQTAAYIGALGLDPEDLATGAATGGCASLLDHVPSLTQQVARISQQHLAYPVLHYLHPLEPAMALPVRLAALDEALRLMEGALPECGDAAERTRPLRATIGKLLDDLDAVVGAADAPPPLPRLARRDRGGGTPEGAAAPFERDALRRRRLLAFVRRDGWEWSDLSEER